MVYVAITVASRKARGGSGSTVAWHRRHAERTRGPRQSKLIVIVLAHTFKIPNAGLRSLALDYLARAFSLKMQGAGRVALPMRVARDSRLHVCSHFSLAKSVPSSSAGCIDLNRLERTLYSLHAITLHTPIYFCPIASYSKWSHLLG